MYRFYTDKEIEREYLALKNRILICQERIDVLRKELSIIEEEIEKRKNECLRKQ